jgi:hypothetical protein
MAKALEEALTVSLKIATSGGAETSTEYFDSGI